MIAPWSLHYFVNLNPISLNVLFASFFFLMKEFSFRCKPYYHRFQLGMNWSYYSITSRKRRFNLTIFRGKCRRESIQQSTQRWTPADAWKRLVQKSPCSWQLFWVSFVFFKRLLCHFKYCAAFVLVCNELHVNFLGLLSLQEEASSFFFLQASEGQYDWGGRFFLKHAPFLLLLFHRESPLILIILSCLYFLFRQNWSLSTEETSAYRPVSWDAKRNNRIIQRSPALLNH